MGGGIRCEAQSTEVVLLLEILRKARWRRVADRLRGDGAARMWGERRRVDCRNAATSEFTGQPGTSPRELRFLECVAAGKDCFAPSLAQELRAFGLAHERLHGPDGFRPLLQARPTAGDVADEHAGASGPAPARRRRRRPQRTGRRAGTGVGEASQGTGVEAVEATVREPGGPRAPPRNVRLQRPNRARARPGNRRWLRLTASWPLRNKDRPRIAGSATARKRGTIAAARPAGSSPTWLG